MESSERTSRRVVQFMDSLGFGRGGLTSAVYKRMALIPSDVELVVAVTGMQFGVGPVFEELRRQGRIPEHAKLRAFFDEEFGGPSLQLREPSHQWPHDSLTIREAGASSTHVRYFDKDGTFLGLERLDSQGHPVSRDIHSKDRPHEIVRRDHFDKAGNLRRSEWFDDQWKPRYETFYRSEGNAFASTWLNDSGGRYRSVLFSREGEVRLARDYNGMRIPWVEALLEEVPGTVALSDEPSTVFALAQSRKIGSVRGLAAIHTVHYANNVDSRNGYRGWFHYYRVGQGNIDEIVTLTGEQWKALAEAGTGIGDEKTSVVPHAAPDWDSPVRQQPTGNLLYLGRLHRDKRID